MTSEQARRLEAFAGVQTGDPRLDAMKGAAVISVARRLLADEPEWDYLGPDPNDPEGGEKWGPLPAQDERR